MSRSKVSTVLNHTHPPLGRYASSHVQAPRLKNCGSAPVLSVLHIASEVVYNDSFLNGKQAEKPQNGI